MDNYLLNRNRRLLLLEDVDGKDRLKLFDKIGLDSKYTDFSYALLRNTERTDDLKHQIVKYDIIGKDLDSRYYVQDKDLVRDVPKDYIGHGARIVTVLPVQYEKNVKTDENGVPYVLYGMYPQTVATKQQMYYTRMLRQETEDRYVFSNLRAYLTDVTGPESFKSYAKEYSFDGKRFADMRITNASTVLFSNGSEAQSGDFVMFRVEPIKWYLDEETGLLVSEKVLSSSIPYEYMAKHEDNVKRLTKRNKNN